MKKFVLSVLSSLALTGLVFAQEASVSFENKISSDVVSIAGGTVEFAGITEKVAVEVETENVDVGLTFITDLSKDDADNLGITNYEFDTAYIEFRPFEILSVDFNRKVFTAGSYLPIADDNVGNGNISSEFAFLLRPVEGLTFGAGMKLPSVFASAGDKVDFDAGVDYATDMFSIGATLRSPINNLGFGVFGSFTGVENLVLNLGFAYNDDFCDVAGNLLTFSATYEVSIFAIAMDFVTNFGNEGTDLYTALCVETGITENLILETQATLNMDFNDSSAIETIAELGAAYTAGNHKVRAGIAVDITDSVGISFPVYYKYSF